jgi:hypothetical protein
MKLPNRELAEVPERKITHYLLNPGHPAGGSKAAFFLRFGFRMNDWEQLSVALLEHANENDVATSHESDYGTRHVVEGPLTAPDGTRLNIRCVWFIEVGDKTPRFVTAYPLSKP